MHLVCNHTPGLLEAWGSLALFSNQASESYNKTANAAWKHSMRSSPNGQASESNVQ